MTDFCKVFLCLTVIQILMPWWIIHGWNFGFYGKKCITCKMIMAQLYGSCWQRFSWSLGTVCSASRDLNLKWPWIQCSKPTFTRLLLRKDGLWHHNVMTSKPTWGFPNGYCDVINHKKTAETSHACGLIRWGLSCSEFSNAGGWRNTDLLFTVQLSPAFKFLRFPCSLFSLNSTADGQKPETLHHVKTDRCACKFPASVQQGEKRF